MTPEQRQTVEEHITSMKRQHWKRVALEDITAEFTTVPAFIEAFRNGDRYVCHSAQWYPRLSDPDGPRALLGSTSMIMRLGDGYRLCGPGYHGVVPTEQLLEHYIFLQVPPGESVLP